MSDMANVVLHWISWDRGGYFGDIYALKDEIRRRHEEIFRRQPPIVREVDHADQREFALENIQQHGIVEGMPYSEQRRNQVRRLWRLNKSALHIHTDRDDMGLWEDWALGLAQGTSFFASAMRHVSMMVHHPLHNAFQQVAPIDADSRGLWLNKPEAWCSLTLGSLYKRRISIACTYVTYK